nr:hypothetical protein [Pseudomonas tolaasii]
MLAGLPAMAVYQSPKRVVDLPLSQASQLPSEIMDLKKEKNFFETRVIEYQTGGALSWD